MAPTPKSADKKQRSLTSFFTPKTLNGLAASFEKQSQEAAAVAAAAAKDHEPSSRKRPLEDSDKGNQSPEQPSKKTKGDSEDAERSSFFSKTDASDVRSKSRTVPNSRTERYLYGGSSSREAEDGDRDEDAEDEAEERRRQEELHRKFVRKLGHPDALAWRRRGQQEEVPRGDDEDVDGDAEEDEAPVPAKGKKKGSKTGKLTPMEMQFLDIKRKHLDTILIMEVGYKFRFLGEDARIAAKELSIVCIPGKMRYDERKLLHPPTLNAWS